MIKYNIGVMSEKTNEKEKDLSVDENFFIESIMAKYGSKCL